MLKIHNLTKIYGEKRAVDHLTLHIQPGEIYGFIGHNGAGKTTTIKSVCGILQFDEGEIYIDGISIKDDPITCKEKIAYIPDNPDLYEFMTGIQFLNFIGDIVAKCRCAWYNILWIFIIASLYDDFIGNCEEKKWLQAIRNFSRY